MADELGLASAFPPPPKAFELFTNENVEAFKADPLQVSPEIAEAMAPPELPTEAYTIFGERWPLEDVLPTLKDSGVEQLYPDDYDRVLELKRLSQSLLLNFLELCTIMGTAPEEFPPKIEHLKLIMLNMHHLINEYRPHQSRESLIMMMEEQLKRRTKETEEIEATNLKTREILDKYKDFLTPAVQDVKVTSNGHPPEPTASDAQAEAAKQRDLYMFEVLSQS